ncbi:MAG: hypothetical protein M0R17_01440 [Candidatus Omnitrophica bacterium]|jgi:hypothetical protein|nr:hypothetical protein [Candidatus Omnitrophota bacterium]
MNINKFFRTIFFADFFKQMFNPKDESVSSTRFIAVFSGILLPISWVALSFYCAARYVGMPGGSTEGYIGLFTIATLGKAYTSYNERKAAEITNPNVGITTTTEESSKSKTEVTSAKDDVKPI